MRFINAILNMLFPPKCVFCRRILEREELSERICRRCRRALPWRDAVIPESETGENMGVVAAPLRYAGDVRRSIHRFKFNGMADYAAPYGKLVAAEVTRALAGRYDIITWVPVSERRRKKRGYDQSMLLASATALELGEVAADTLSKVRDNPAQSSLSEKRDRHKNVSGAYCVIAPELVAGKRVLLIDDVYTSGATMDECAKTLIEAGALAVTGAVLARAGDVEK